MRARHPDLRPLGWVCVALAAFSGALALGFMHLTGRPIDAVAALACAAPPLLAVAMAASSRTDRRQYVARCLAVVLMAPILLAMWAGSVAGSAPASRSWLVGAAAAALQGLAWALHFMWAASVATRLEPPPEVTPVDAAQLRARLQSLAGAGWPVAWQDEAGQGIRSSTPNDVSL